MAIQNYQEETLNLTAADFARKCPPPETLEKLWELSVQYERTLFPTAYASDRLVVDDTDEDLYYLGEKAMKIDFDEASKTSLCALDVDVILSSPSWRNFFNSMNNPDIVVHPPTPIPPNATSFLVATRLARFGASARVLWLLLLESGFGGVSATLFLIFLITVVVLAKFQFGHGRNLSQGSKEGFRWISKVYFIVRFGQDWSVRICKNRTIVS